MVKRAHFIEIGRVAEINYGPDAGKIAVIIDIVDQSRALIDGPHSLTGVSRQTIPFRNLSLTPIKLDIIRCPRETTLSKAAVKAKMIDQWKATNWAKKLEKQRVRANLSDFDRFKVMILRKQRSRAVGREAKSLRRGPGKAKKAVGKKADTKAAAKGKAK